MDTPTPTDATQRRYRGEPIVRLHAMAKPIGPSCNLDCTYCYYLSKQGLLHAGQAGRISDELLETFIRQYIEAQNFRHVVFSWQGGEPALLGLDFFKRVVALEKKYCPKHIRCENDLQTNGTLLDDDWCRFLRKENFLVGLSIDGPKHLHDHYRKDIHGQGSHDRVMRSVRLLHKHKVPFATLSCVNNLTGKHPLEVYRFLRDEVRSPRMQFIPIVEPRGFESTAPQCWPEESLPMQGSPRVRPDHPDSIVEPWCVDPDDWGTFLCTIFDEWEARDRGVKYVHYFDACVQAWMGDISPLCVFAPMCGKGVALEHDGTVYACDHFVYPDFALGNIKDTDIGDLSLSDRQERFGHAKEGLLPQQCRRCEYQFACFGECPKNRCLKTAEGEPGLNYLCSGWKRFFAHIDQPMQTIVRQLGRTPQYGKGITC